MTDSRLRELEMRAANGDREADDELVASRLRLGLGWFGEPLPSSERGSLHVDAADGSFLPRPIYEWVVEGCLGDPACGAVEMVHVPAGIVLCLGPCAGQGGRAWAGCPCGGRGYVKVEAFWVARSTVTCGQFTQYTAFSDTPLVCPRWASEIRPDELDDYPVTNITRQQALSWCEWAGLSLPSWHEMSLCCEAEVVLDHEHGKHRLASTRPWGDAPPAEDVALIPWRHENASFESPRPSVVRHRVFDSARGQVSLKVVQRPKGASRFGVLDPFGNVAQWVSDSDEGRPVAFGPTYRDARSIIVSEDQRDDVGFRPVLRLPPSVAQIP